MTGITNDSSLFPCMNNSFPGSSEINRHEECCTYLPNVCTLDSLRREMVQPEQPGRPNIHVLWIGTEQMLLLTDIDFFRGPSAALKGLEAGANDLLTRMD